MHDICLCTIFWVGVSSLSKYLSPHSFSWHLLFCFLFKLLQMQSSLTFSVPCHSHVPALGLLYSGFRWGNPQALHVSSFLFDIWHSKRLKLVHLTGFSEKSHYTSPLIGQFFLHSAFIQWMSTVDCWNIPPKKCALLVTTVTEISQFQSGGSSKLPFSLATVLYVGVLVWLGSHCLIKSHPEIWKWSHMDLSSLFTKQSFGIMSSCQIGDFGE